MLSAVVRPHVRPQRSRVHHYVPEFYLRGWCGPSRKLWVTRVVNGRLVESQLAPRSTGFEEDLYTVNARGMLTEHPDEKSDRVESGVLRDVDTAGAEALRVLLTGDLSQMSERHRRSWARFLHSLFVRAPDRLKDHDDLGRRTVEEALQTIIDDAPATDREQVSAVCRVVRPLVDATTMVRDIMARRINEQDQIEGFLIRRWWLLTAQNRTFATSDRPMVLNGGRGDLPAHYIWMALSPRHVFFQLPSNATSVDEKLVQLAAVAHEAMLLKNRPRYLYSAEPLSPELKARAATELTPVSH